MTRILIGSLILASSLSMTVIEAGAQSKPKAKCVPVEVCIKACGARGGQIRLCPRYCNDKARTSGC